MKKLILPLLFIFLAAAAFGQTKKEMPKINAKEFKQVDHYSMSAEKMKKLKANPALSSYFIFGPKGIKPKAGYGFLSAGEDQLITWKQGKSGKPDFDKYTWEYVGTEKPIYSQSPAFVYNSSAESVRVLIAIEECHGTPSCDCWKPSDHSGPHECRPRKNPDGTRDKDGDERTEEEKEEDKKKKGGGKNDKKK